MTSDSSGPSTHFGFDGLIARIAAALGKARIPYMVIGGQAVLLHGEPRLTRDLDLKKIRALVQRAIVVRH